MFSASTTGKWFYFIDGNHGNHGCLRGASIQIHCGADAGQLLLESGFILWGRAVTVTVALTLQSLSAVCVCSASTTGKWFYFIDYMMPHRSHRAFQWLPLLPADGGVSSTGKWSSFINQRCLTDAFMAFLWLESGSMLSCCRSPCCLNPPSPPESCHGSLQPPMLSTNSLFPHLPSRTPCCVMT